MLCGRQRHIRQPREKSKVLYSGCSGRAKGRKRLHPAWTGGTGLFRRRKNGPSPLNRVMRPPWDLCRTCVPQRQQWMIRREKRMPNPSRANEKKRNFSFFRGPQVPLTSILSRSFFQCKFAVTAAVTCCCAIFFSFRDKSVSYLADAIDSLRVVRSPL